MNFNRRKNIFTLGDFQLLADNRVKVRQRQNDDPFEHDPFKVQSYNFHYAERPFPLQNIVNRINTGHQPSVKPFETFYYNPEFSSYQRGNNNKDKPNINKFHENRRRRFLQSTNQATYTNPTLLGPSSIAPAGVVTGGNSAIHRPREVIRPNVTPIAYMIPVRPSSGVDHAQYNRLPYAIPTTSPLLRTTCTPEYMRDLHPTNSNTSCISTKVFQRSAQRSVSITAIGRTKDENWRSTSNVIKSSSSTSIYRPKGGRALEEKKVVNATVHRNNSSGCQININIKGLKDSDLGENFTINIQSENSEVNTNLNNKENSTFKVRSKNQLIDLMGKPENRNTSGSNDNLAAIRQNRSNVSFILEKELSKYSLRNQSRERESPSMHSIKLNTGSQTREPSLDRKSSSRLHNTVPSRPVIVNTNANNANKSSTNSPQRYPLNERIPSVIPWNNQTKLMPISPQIQSQRTRKTSTQPNNVSYQQSQQRQRSYLQSNSNSNFNDIRRPRTYGNNVPNKLIQSTPMQLRQQQKPQQHQQLSAGVTLQRPTPERKLLNTNCGVRSKRYDDLIKVYSSSISICGNKSNKSLTVNTPRGNRSSKILVNPQTPLSVNINVFTDKLKLTRP